MALVLIFNTDPGIGQSLADAARKEAERRKELQARGIEGKVIGADDVSARGRSGNPGIAVPDPSVRAPAKRQSESAPRRTLIFYRAELLRLDRQIRQTEERITLLRARIQADRWALSRTGKSSGSARGGLVQQKLQQQVEEQELKVKRIREDRLRIYDAARRSGYLPGELDGKGITP